MRNFSNKVSQKQKKTNTWSVALSHRETGSDLWLRIMGRSVQPSALMHVCVHMCVWWVFGWGLMSRLIFWRSPRHVSPPPRDRPWQTLLWQWDTCVTVTLRGTRWVEGGPALTCWPRAVWNTEPQMGSLTETNEIKKNKRRKEAQTEKQSYCSWGEVHSSLWKCTQHLIRTVLQHLSLFLLDLWLCFVWMHDCH